MGEVRSLKAHPIENIMTQSKKNMKSAVVHAFGQPSSFGLKIKITAFRLIPANYS